MDCMQITLLTERIPVISQKIKVNKEPFGRPSDNMYKPDKGESGQLQEKYIEEEREEWRKHCHYYSTSDYTIINASYKFNSFLFL
jgi:hypothetical protein